MKSVKKLDQQFDKPINLIAYLFVGTRTFSLCNRSTQFILYNQFRNSESLTSIIS